IFTAAESPLEKDLLWVGTDDGLIQVSKDGGKNWENVTPKDSPKWMMWNKVEVDPFKKGAAYFVGTRYKLDDFRPYIYKTEDYGKTWKLIVNGINTMHFTRAVAADPKRPGLIYAGTEYGMYISYDDGANWRSFQLNLPIVPITDLTTKNNDLIVATQGRSIYMIDDLTPLQDYNASITSKDLHVFNVNSSYRMEGRSVANTVNAGMNPPNGAVINFFAKNVTDSTKASIEIFDKNKKSVRVYSTDSKDSKMEISQGMNQFVWDMIYPAGERIDGMILWNGVPGGIKAIPGNYTARVKVGKDSSEVPFTVLGDPNFKTTQADYEAQFGLLNEMMTSFNDIQKGVKDIRNYRTQISDFVSRQGKDVPKDVKSFADSIQKKMTTVEETLYQTKAKSFQDVLNYPIRLNDKLAGVFRTANSGNFAPSKQSREVYAELKQQADAALAKLKEIKEKDIAAFNKMVREKELPLVK
ncbi:MAG: WD40/YVTN/BNR-like repeat-containing protein, partial [Flavitalea sp.]